MTPELTERRIVPAEPEVQPPIEAPKEPEGLAGAGEPGRSAYAVAATAPSEEERRLGWGPASLLFIGALLVLVGMTSWFEGQGATVTFEILLGPGFRAILAIVAGILVLAPRVRPEVATGFLTGCTAAAAIGVLTTTGVAIANGIENVKTGWLLAMVGQSLIAFTGLLVISMTAWRSPLPRGGVAWRDAATYAVLAAGGLTAVLFFNYATFVGSVDVSGAGYFAAAYYIWALVTVALALLALVARPSAAGRLMLLAWAFAVIGFALSEWVYLTDHSTESKGMPALVIAGMLLAVAGGFIGRRASGKTSA